MKKNIIVLIMAVAIMSSYAQIDTICGIIPYKDGKVCYEGVTQVTNTTASTLYGNAKIWIANNFGSAKNVIQTDVPNSSIVIKGIIDEDTDVTYDFTLTLQFKDGKYKYTLTDLVFHFWTAETPVEQQPFMSSCFEKTVIKFDAFLKSFIKRVESGITTDNNW